MPVPRVPVAWVGSLWWLLGLTILAFAVPYVFGNRVILGRLAYVTVLTTAAVAATAGYVWWLGIGVGDLVSARWFWGIVTAPVFGAIGIVVMRKLPVVKQRRGGELTFALVWDGLVYGVAEGLLLSALPAFMTWQMVESLGWSGYRGGLARWTLPLIVSMAVIVVHHLGYWNFRNRKLLAMATIVCAPMTLGFLLTASWISPTLSHAVAHGSALLHGGELPPHQRPGRAAPDQIAGQAVLGSAAA